MRLGFEPTGSGLEPMKLDSPDRQNRRWALYSFGHLNWSDYIMHLVIVFYIMFLVSIC